MSNVKRETLASMILAAELAWHESGGGNKNEYIADYLLLRGVTVPEEPHKLKPCPFCDTELEHNAAMNTWEHPDNGCILSAHYINGPEVAKRWDSRPAEQALHEAVAMEHDCHTCVHGMDGLDQCEQVSYICADCNAQCGCRACVNGSNWIWKGTGGKV